MRKLFIIGTLVLSIFGASTVKAADGMLDSAKRMASDAAKATKSAASDAADYADDAAITAAVKARFLKQNGLDSLDISVSTEAGVVLLSGVVDHAAQINLADRVANEVKGVKSVDNRLTPKHLKSAKETVGDYLDDAAITAEVKARLLAQKGLGATGIMVSTKEGVVRLEGTVDHLAQVALAERVAGDVKGVRKVENMLQETR